MDTLIAVRKDVQMKTEQMEKSVRVAEREYSKKMAELNRGFEVGVVRSLSTHSLLNYAYGQSVGGSFSGMEVKMNEVGRTAIRIGRFPYSFFIFPLSLLDFIPGEQLETVHIERQRAQAAHDLIDYYNQFSKGDTAKLDALRKEGREGRRQVAVLLRRLTTVAKEVDLPSAEKVRIKLLLLDFE